MRAILLLLVALVGVYVGQKYLTPDPTRPALIHLPCIPIEVEMPALGKQPAGRTIKLPCPEAAAGIAGDTPIDDWATHGVSALFAVMALFLLIKYSEQQVVALFAVAVLATLFGRYIEPLQLPDFLSAAPLLPML
jgi:hypothetical protein